MDGSGAFCTSHALPSKPRYHASLRNFSGVCSVFCLRLFCLNFSGKSAGGRKVSLCRAAGGADGHFRPNKRHLRTAPDPDSDGAEAGPLSSATPAYRIGPRKCVFTYSIEYLDRRLRISKKAGVRIPAHFFENAGSPDPAYNFKCLLLPASCPRLPQRGVLQLGS